MKPGSLQITRCFDLYTLEAAHGMARMSYSRARERGIVNSTADRVKGPRLLPAASLHFAPVQTQPCSPAEQAISCGKLIGPPGGGVWYVCRRWLVRAASTVARPPLVSSLFSTGRLPR